MTPEAADYLAQARYDRSDARKIPGTGLARAASRIAAMLAPVERD